MPGNGGPVFPGTFLDLKTTFCLSFYNFLHCTPNLVKNEVKGFFSSKFALPGVMFKYERERKVRGWD